ncbi:CMGC SRPK kinase protein [Rutstroemia sp. NJR-2017a BBW]|nr:CMGC SRPK kinase protein [Rutstroemia sp. NJR-2017a BBW]
MFFRPLIFLLLRTPVLNRSCLTSFSLCRVGRVASRTVSSSAAPFEEEREVGFQNFYSMTLGEVINDKYKVMAKLGFRSASTIWCCCNLASVNLRGLLTRYISTNKYAALKIYAHDLVAEDDIDNETAVYKHLSTAGNPDHPGKMYVRTIQDSLFVTNRAGNRHQCLVHGVLSNDILNLRYAHPDRKLPEAMLKQILIHLLLALDYLHSECYIIHTGQVTPFTLLRKY